MKRVFIGAHLDDVEIGCGGLLSTLKKQDETKDIKIYVLSMGIYNSSYNKQRLEIFKKNMELLGITDYKYFPEHHMKYIDTEFQKHYHVIKNRMETICKELIEFDVNEIYFHIADNHFDHQIINQLSKEIFRPFLFKNLHKLIEYEIPNSNIYGVPGDDFDTYHLFDENIKDQKLELLNNYIDTGLDHTYDARDPMYVIAANRQAAFKFGYEYGERYNIIWQRFFLDNGDNNERYD